MNGDLAVIPARAASELERVLSLLNQSPLTERRVPLFASRSAASDDDPLSVSSISPRGPAVEAGRPANPSEPGRECTCPVCNSDMAGIVPCEREENL